ncbi:HORMA domain-containing protein 1, partial [Quaeritorhiza haematococci]
MPDVSVNGMALKSLRRDYSEQADSLINWLEQGTFDALEKKYLKTLIFGIFLDPDDPELLVESYTFHFAYPAEGLYHISIDACGKEAFKFRTKRQIMKATSEMLRRLLMLTQTLKPLPDNANITMKLFYYDDVTPPDYEPPLFMAGDNSKLFYFDQEPQRIKIGELQTPYHAVNLNVQTAVESIDPTEDDIMNAQPTLLASESESDIENEMEAEAENEAGVETEPTIASEPPQEPQESADQQRVETSETLKQTDHQDQTELALAQRMRQMTVESEMMFPMTQMTQESTQDLISALKNGTRSKSQRSLFDASPHLFEDAPTVKSLSFSQGLREESVDFGALVTPGVGARGRAAGGGGEEEVETLPRNRSAMSIALADKEDHSPAKKLEKNASGVAGTEEMEMKLKVQSKGNTAERETRAIDASGEDEGMKGDDAAKVDVDMNLEPISDHNAHEHGHEDPENMEISCTCGVNETDGPMLQCTHCKKWAHLVCFGYLSPKDERIPKRHICYQCEFDASKSSDAAPLYDMNRVAEVTLFRRALCTVWEEGCPTIRQLAKRLGVDLSLGTQLNSRLRKEGFIKQDRRGRPKKGKTSSKTPAIKTEQTRKAYEYWMSDECLPRGGGGTDKMDLGKVVENSGEVDGDGIALAADEDAMAIDETPADAVNTEDANAKTSNQTRRSRRSRQARRSG